MDVDISVSKLTPADLESVDELMKLHSQTLGFLPRAALRDYLCKEGVIGAKNERDQLIGYLLYGKNRDYFRICQLCVVAQYRGQGIARRLVDSLKQSATTQKAIRLRCRRDFAANDIWPKLGFVPLDEGPGRSKDGHRLTRWYRSLAPDDQLSLFQMKTSAETLDVIVDAQIFFDFSEPNNHKTKTSKALLSDFLGDSLKLWITDEIFNEINRQDDPEQRRESRERAHSFSIVEPDQLLAERIEERLKKILPTHRESQTSDVRHLAKASACDVMTFVTRDQSLLKKSERISEITGLRVVNPVDLIINLHELSARQSYAPDRIAGLDLRWERLTSNDLSPFRFDSFLKRGETRGRFRAELEPLIAQPNQHKCELLRSGNEIIAIRVLSKSSNRMLIASFARVARSIDQGLFGRFLIADTVSNAVDGNLDVVKFRASSLAPSLIRDMLDMGFTESNDSFVRFCFSSCLDRETTSTAISKLCPESIGNYQEMSDLELERCCSPLALEATDQRYFLVPIRPGYAISLIDRHESADDLFGGNPNVLLRWNNVYYKKKTHHRMLRTPARILWYVSKPRKHIIAVSRLDDVAIDTPKVLFSSFEKFGILEWNDLYRMCDGDISSELLALKFSNTFVFRKPVSLDVLRSICKKSGISPSLQGPAELPECAFHEIYRAGFPDESGVQ